MIECDHANSYHRYGSDEPTPDRARIADSVSVVRCNCGKVCLRFHHPATTTHPGRIFAAAYLDDKDCANLGEEVSSRPGRLASQHTVQRRSLKLHGSLTIMAPRPKPRFERVDIPRQFIELAERRTEFLFHVMRWDSQSMKAILASAYLQGINDASDALEKRLDVVPAREPEILPWHC